MNFSIKLFAVALLIVAHQTVAMHGTKRLGSRAIRDTQQPNPHQHWLLDQSRGESVTQSSDGVFCVQTWGKREFLGKRPLVQFNAIGELICSNRMKKKLDKFEVAAVFDKGETECLIPVGSYSFPNRFLLRVTTENGVDIVDTNKEATIKVGSLDVTAENELIKSAHMSHDGFVIALFDKEGNELRVANPLR